MCTTVPVVDRLIAELHRDRPWVRETQTFAEAMHAAEQDA